MANNIKDKLLDIRGDAIKTAARRYVALKDAGVSETEAAKDPLIQYVESEVLAINEAIKMVDDFRYDVIDLLKRL